MQSVADRFTADHFRLLRKALVRITAERLSPEQFAVTSSSVEGKRHFVSTSGLCSCPATKGCTHAALALDVWMESDADTYLYRTYGDARREDRLALRIRIDAGELSRDDKEYLKLCVRKIEESRPWLVREVVSVRSFSEATALEAEHADAMVAVSNGKREERVRGFQI